MDIDTNLIDTNEIDTGRIDVVVVGGGIAGLTAAVLAHEAGLSVRLIEKQARVGGRAETREHRGLALNRGPHALYRTGHLKAMLDRLGVEVTGVTPRRGQAYGAMASRTGRLPDSAWALLSTPLLSPRSKVKLAALMAGPIGRTESGSLASVSVDEWLDGLSGGRRDLRLLLGGLVRLVTYNSAADLASADAALANLQLALGPGVVYVDHGWGSIVEALRDRLPADAVVHAEVATVESTGSGTRCTVSDGSTLTSATTIIAAGLPATVDRLLGTVDRFATAAGPAVEASVLDLGLSTPPRSDFLLGLDDAVYSSVHSHAHGIAPNGTTLLSLARYRRPGEELGPAETRARLMALAARNGIGAGDITVDRYLHRVPVVGGMPLASRGGLLGRPGVVVDDRPGVFLAGDWVGPRGLLADAAAASAEDAVNAAISTVAARSATMVS